MIPNYLMIPQPLFDDPQLFDDQLEVWTLIIEKSTVILPSLMVLFLGQLGKGATEPRGENCLLSQDAPSVFPT